MGIAIVPEGRGVFINKSVEENLEVGTFFHKRPAARDKELLVDGSLVAAYLGAKK